MVLPDRVLSPGTVVIDDGRIVEIKSSAATAGGASNFAFHGHYIVPGFIDVHVHGVEGVDSLGGDTPIASIARRLPKFGVTAFCPTTVACAPSQLRGVLEQVRRARETRSFIQRALPPSRSNFISPEYKGAQPLPVCEIRASLWRDPEARGERRTGRRIRWAQVLDEIERGAPTSALSIAPEIDGGLDLIKWLTARGLRSHWVSLGHVR
jgi:N-acetylglucosamine-6-phosphate deacetylase